MLAAIVLGLAGCFDPQVQELVVDQRTSIELEEISDGTGGLEEVPTEEDASPIRCRPDEGSCGFWMYSSQNQLTYLLPEGDVVDKTRVSVLVEDRSSILGMTVDLDVGTMFLLRGSREGAEGFSLVLWDFEFGEPLSELSMEGDRELGEPVAIAAHWASKTGTIVLTRRGVIVELLDDAPSEIIVYGEELAQIDPELLEDVSSFALSTDRTKVWLLSTADRSEREDELVRVDLETNAAARLGTGWNGLAGIVALNGPDLWAVTVSGDTALLLDPEGGGVLDELRIPEPASERIVALASDATFSEE